MIVNFALLPSAITQIGIATFIPGTMFPGGPAGPIGPAGPSGINAQPAFAINTITLSTYTVAPSDQASVLRFTVAASCAVTLPGALTPGWWAYFDNDLNGVVTLTPSGSNIDGVASMSIDPACTALLYFNGANYESLGVTDGGSF